MDWSYWLPLVFLGLLGFAMTVYVTWYSTVSIWVWAC